MRCWTAVFFALSVAPLFAQEKQPPPTYECRWATGPIKIDGKADEAAWQRAQLIDNFGLPWLKDDARKAKTATKARLLWDRDNLYFLADLEDHDLFADLTQHDDRTWFNDVNVRTNRPAPTTSTSDKAIWRMTIRLPKPKRDSPTIERPCSFSASCGWTRVARMAGTVPKSSAVVIATIAVKPSTIQSIPVTVGLG